MSKNEFDIIDKLLDITFKPALKIKNNEVTTVEPDIRYKDFSKHTKLPLDKEGVYYTVFGYSVLPYEVMIVEELEKTYICASVEDNTVLYPIWKDLIFKTKNEATEFINKREEEKKELLEEDNEFNS